MAATRGPLAPLRCSTGRVRELVLFAALLSRDKRFAGYGPQAMLDAFEASLFKHVVASSAWHSVERDHPGITYDAMSGADSEAARLGRAWHASSALRRPR